MSVSTTVVEETFEEIISKQNSSIGFIEGTTHFIIDDYKMIMRSSNCAKSGWSRSKGLKSYGPVNNLICSVSTGLLLSSHMTHFGESALDATEIALQHITGTQLARNIRLPNTHINGDRGYNDNEILQSFSTMELSITNTVKRSPVLPFKIWRYKI